MTLILHWWYFPIILVILPFLYSLIRKSEGQYDFLIDTMVILIGCWASAIGILIGHFVN